MLSIIKRAAGKPIRLAAIIPLAVALLIVSSPGPAPVSAAATSDDTPGNTIAQEQPEATCPSNGQCFFDVPSNNPFYEFVNRIYQQDLVSGYACGGIDEPCDAENRPYYRPAATVNRQQMAKFIDNARRLPDIVVEGSTTGTLDALIRVHNYSLTGEGIGIYGRSVGDGVGVYGFGQSGSGVHGQSYGGNGVSGTSTNGRGISGTSTNGRGVYGTSTSGWAGWFSGDVYILGSCTGCFGPSKVDHPLDPENQYLYHSPVQSDDMMNIYNGNVTTGANGEATIQLPEWFEVLNRDFRYQLTILGDQFAQARVSSEIKDNSFTLKTDKPNVKVSWQVTGTRQDPYANANRTPVEEEKPAGEKGKYLHPAEWGQPGSLGIDHEQQATETKP